MQDPPYYHEQAERAQRLARSQTNREVEGLLLRMAQDYEDLAEDLENGAIEIRHPELLPVYFGNYRRLVYLAQTDDDRLTTTARRGARRLGLAFERRFTGLGGLAAPIAAFSRAPAVAPRAHIGSAGPRRTAMVGGSFHDVPDSERRPDPAAAEAGPRRFRGTRRTRYVHDLQRRSGFGHQMQTPPVATA